MRCDEPDSGQRAPVRALRACLITEIFHPEDQGCQGQQAFALARQLHASGVAVRLLLQRKDYDLILVQGFKAMLPLLFELVTSPASERACV
jgi:hypothetical protein